VHFLGHRLDINTVHRQRNTETDSHYQLALTLT